MGTFGTVSDLSRLVARETRTKLFEEIAAASAEGTMYRTLGWQCIWRWLLDKSLTS